MHIEKLHADVLFYMFTFLMLDDVAKLPRLNKKFAAMFNNPSFWKQRGYLSVENAKKSINFRNLVLSKYSKGSTSLDLTSEKVYYTEGFPPSVYGLEQLFLSDNRINADLSGLGVLSNLRVLYLKNNWIKGGHVLGGLSALTNLEELSLNGNVIVDLSYLPSSLNKLRILSLINNSIRTLDPLPSFSNLETLELDGNRLNCLERIAKKLPKLPKLRSLSLFGNPLKQTNKEQFRALCRESNIVLFMEF